MNKKLLCLILSVLGIVNVWAQGGSSPNFLQNYHPVSPSAFEFLKYTSIPVSEYTGVPNINVPIYEIKEDGLTIPINLTYHAGGIRVSQESSWVGLGWDMNFGSIVQEINDVDDYSTGSVKLKPDWTMSPAPQLWQSKYAFSSCGYNSNTSYQNTVPVNPPQASYSYPIFTAYYAPFNGNANNQPLGEQFFTYPNYDSEPDIFQANFFGQSLTFTTAGVQNKDGYSVSKTTNGFCIKDPDGNQFYFEIGTSTVVISNTDGGISSGGYVSGEPNSKLWMISKIITRNKRVINFSYTQSSSTNNFPSYSEKFYKYTYQGYLRRAACEIGSSAEGYVGLLRQPLARTTSQATETRLVLTNISFPSGSVTFNTSARTDMLQAKKLDGVEIRNYQNKLIKSIQLNFDYTDATNITTNGYAYNTTTFGATAFQRLRLLSVLQNDGGQYQFTYNTTQLPPKNSFGQDFWGYYNGQTSNTSLIPNPARLLIPGMASNGNNNSANPTYAQAGILTQIKYPTGGSSNFEYELNQFDNYFVPDFSTTGNTISSGNGLRVAKITFKSDNNTLSKITKYQYESGKAILPITFMRTYSINALTIEMNPHYMRDSSFLINELDGKGFFTTSFMGSSNGVGYGKVTKLEVDAANNALGRQESYYNNTPDVISNSALGTSQLSAVLPATKSRDVPENGTLQKQMQYNAQNTLLSKTENSYSIILSDLNYGTRLFGYGAIYYGDPGQTQMNSTWFSVPRNLVGYYPVYDKQSQLIQSIRTDYDANGNSIVNSRSMSYDSYGNVTQDFMQPSTNGISGEALSVGTYYSYPYTNSSLPTNLLLIQQHQISQLTNSKRTRIKNVPNNSPNYIDDAIVNHEFVTNGSNIVKSKSTLTNNSGSMPMTTIVNFTNYDPNANLLEFNTNGQTNSMLWDYNSEYVTAECKNSLSSNFATTSFEAENKGNFSFTGISYNDNNAVTGSKVYSLPTGNITKTGLDVNKSFKVSYWSNSGPQIVNGTSAIAGRTLNGYTYYEHIVPSPLNGTITISGSSSIDELRLYPKEAQLSTYTYIPMVGLRTSCDINNKISYYEYDASNRLYIVRDQDKNVIKKICYNYAGQPENCVNSAEPTTVCDGTTCSGVDKKCINGFCETGTKIVISSVSQGRGQWLCTYVYQFSDCSHTIQYTETKSSSCPVSLLCE